MKCPCCGKELTHADANEICPQSPYKLKLHPIVVMDMNWDIDPRLAEISSAMIGDPEHPLRGALTKVAWNEKPLPGQGLGGSNGTG